MGCRQWLDTHDTPAAPRRPGRGEGSAVKAGELRGAELVILFVALQRGFAGALLSLTAEGNLCLASFCQRLHT